MYGMKITAAFYMLSCGMIFLGFLAQFTSFSKVGHTVIMFGYALYMVVCLCLIKINPKASKEHRVYEWISFVCQIFGTIISCLGTINIKGSNSFVWAVVGAVGSLMMLIGGGVILAKEIRVEQLEAKILPVDQGEM